VSLRLRYLTPEVIDVNRLCAGQLNTSNKVGGTVIFLGTVREHDDDENIELSQLYYEAYEAMAEEIFSEIETEARKKWEIEEITVLHRIGSLNVGEVSVFIMVSSKHRREAFDCCKYVIDNVKTRVPIWKMEITNGGKRWLGGTLIPQTEK
jgi:molybdopterin synthase catalytic subunit